MARTTVNAKDYPGHCLVNLANPGKSFSFLEFGVPVGRYLNGTTVTATRATILRGNSNELLKWRRQLIEYLLTIALRPRLCAEKTRRMAAFNEFPLEGANPVGPADSLVDSEIESRTH